MHSVNTFSLVNLFEGALMGDLVWWGYHFLMVGRGLGRVLGRGVRSSLVGSETSASNVCCLLMSGT